LEARTRAATSRVLEGAGRPTGSLPHPSRLPAARSADPAAPASPRSAATTAASRSRRAPATTRHSSVGRSPKKVILGIVQEQIADPEHIAYVPQARRGGNREAALRPPEHTELKETELTVEHRWLANFVDFIGEGRGSQSLANALAESELRVERLTEEVDLLRRRRDKTFRPPPVEWIEDRLSIQQMLEQQTARSAQTLRNPSAHPTRARHARHRPPLLPRGYDPRRSRPHRRTAPRWRGGRFEFFTKVETAGTRDAKPPNSRGIRRLRMTVSRRVPQHGGRPPRARARPSRGLRPVSCASAVPGIPEESQAASTGRVARIVHR